MLEIKKKFVYKINEIENYYGMMRADVYLTMSYFNRSDRVKYNNFMLSPEKISQLLTESIMELLTSEIDIDVDNFNLSLSDIYISAVPCWNGGPTKKFVVLVIENKKILIADSKLVPGDAKSGWGDSIKMKNIEKEKIMSLLFSIHNLVLDLLEDTFNKCKNAQQLSVVLPSKDDTVSECPDADIFNMDNYEKI